MLLSVIVPTRNRSTQLSGLIDSLLKQSSTAIEWEIVIVDNGSTDDTEIVVINKQRCAEVPIKYVLESEPGLHRGRHRGAIEARGKYLAYLDDDMLVSPTWIQGISLIESGVANAVVGKIVPKWEQTPPEWLLRFIGSGPSFGYLGLIDYGNMPCPCQDLYGGNFFISKKLFFELGGVHPDGMPPELLRYRGDGETGLWHKFSASGLSLWFDPEALVEHLIPTERMSGKYLCKRAFSQGISDSYTHARSAGGRLPLRVIGRNLFKMFRDLVIFPISCTPKLMSRYGLIILSTRCRMRYSYWNGYRFHQAEIMRDPELMEWVKRENYY